MGVKLSDLSTETSPASSDIMMIADPATGIAKKITVSALKTFLDSLGGGGSTQLSTPGSFAATPASSTQINLSWTDVANESSYLLEWSPNGSSGWTQIGGTIAAGSTSYNHTGLTASTAYYYRLKAVGNGTTYTDSNYATANGTTSALSRTYITWATPIDTDLELYNSNKGIRKKSGSSASWGDFAYSNTQQLEIGKRICVKADTSGYFSYVGISSSNSGTDYSLIPGMRQADNSTIEGFDGGSYGTSEPIVIGNYYCLFLESASVIKFQKSTDGVTWTTINTASGYSLSGNYYVSFWGNSPSTSYEEVFIL